MQRFLQVCPGTQDLLAARNMRAERRMKGEREEVRGKSAWYARGEVKLGAAGVNPRLSRGMFLLESRLPPGNRTSFT